MVMFKFQCSGKCLVSVTAELSPCLHEDVTTSSGKFNPLLMFIAGTCASVYSSNTVSELILLRDHDIYYNRVELKEVGVRGK